MKYIILIIIILTSYSAYSIKYPNLPKLPKPPTINENIKKKVRNNKKNNEKIAYFYYTIKVVLEKGSITEGSIKLKKNYIATNTKKGDFNYTKNIPIEEINEIEILEWKAFPIKLKLKTDGMAYIFYPNKVKITKINGKQAVYSAKINELHKFKLTNAFGKTTIHSFFYDYWISNKKTQYWHNSKSKDFNYNKKHPHPLVVRKISFKKRKS